MAAPKKARTYKSRKKLSAKYVRSLLDYNPSTGVFRWKIDRRPRGKKGAVAGCVRDDGYILIGIDGAMYFAHRLAWLWMTGHWPKEQIDHKSRNASDNRWINLREASHAQNLFNQGVSKNSRSGIKGIYKRKDCNRWQTSIDRHGRVYYLGLFKTKKEAAAARQLWTKKLHGEFACFK